jgi:hypothetical protein
MFIDNRRVVMRRNLRTTTLAAVVLAASALSLPGSAQAAPWGWHGGCGCVGTGLAAGLIMGGALSSPYAYYVYPGPYYRHRVYVRPRYWLY